jgi:sterol desaturase/sphingolipid hydroxylase (fatty acid hydroxylase superfamily)
MKTTLIAFTILYAIEIYLPFRDFHYTPRTRFQHTYRNIFFAIVTVLMGLLFSGMTTAVFALVEQKSWGLVHLFGWPEAIKAAVAFLLFDLWMYYWHRINHEMSLLWRLHRVHHTDPAMDCTTAFRFHPIEMFLSHVLNLFIFILIGMPAQVLIAYKLVSTPVILFHHSNVPLSPRLDKFLRAVIPTPAMHRLHHSEIMSETNSNYTSLFSWWDRIFGSYCMRGGIESITYGIGFFRKERWHTLRGMLMTPFYKK